MTKNPGAVQFRRLDVSTVSVMGVQEDFWSCCSSISARILKKQVLTPVRECLSKKDQLTSKGEGKQAESRSLLLPMWVPSHFK